MENVILKEIREREAVIAAHAERLGRLDEINAEIAKLEEEAAEIKEKLSADNVEVLDAEIAELKGYAVKLGLIEAETKVEEPVVAPSEPEVADTAEVAEEKPAVGVQTIAF